MTKKTETSGEVIQRFDWDSANGWLTGRPAGEFLRYDDHVRAMDQVLAKSNGFENSWREQKAEIESLKAENARMKEALEWYSEAMYYDGGHYTVDGDVAREALDGCSND